VYRKFIGVRVGRRVNQEPSARNTRSWFDSATTISSPGTPSMSPVACWKMLAKSRLMLPCPEPSGEKVLICDGTADSHCGVVKARVMPPEASVTGRIPDVSDGTVSNAFGQAAETRSGSR
jgi:hypothetical protein